jgi:hypothetical protein
MFPSTQFVVWIYPTHPHAKQKQQEYKKKPTGETRTLAYVITGNWQKKKGGAGTPAKEDKNKEKTYTYF